MPRTYISNVACRYPICIQFPMLFFGSESHGPVASLPGARGEPFLCTPMTGSLQQLRRCLGRLKWRIWLDFYYFNAITNTALVGDRALEACPEFIAQPLTIYSRMPLPMCHASMPPCSTRRLWPATNQALGFSVHNSQIA
jgi:hypothetical protein